MVVDREGVVRQPNHIAIQPFNLFSTCMDRNQEVPVPGRNIIFLDGCAAMGPQKIIGLIFAP